MTIEEYIKSYDEGKGVPSIVLGGLSEGYEFAIQKGAIEVLRSAIESNYSLEEDDEEKTKFKKICNDKINEIDDELGGLSGAMFGALQWLAYYWYKNGIDCLIDETNKRGETDRIIEVFSSGKIIGGNL